MNLRLPALWGRRDGSPAGGGRRRFGLRVRLALTLAISGGLAAAVLLFVTVEMRAVLEAIHSEEALRAIAGYLLLITTAVAVALLAIAEALGREVLRPLARLTRAARALAGGREPLPGRHGGDEIATLTDALNHASAALRGLAGELRASQAEQQALLATLDGVVWLLDPTSRRFTFVSEGAERLLGHPAARWLEAEFLTCYASPEEQAALLAGLAQATQEGWAQFEHRAVTADGESRWLANRVRLLVEGRNRGSLLGITTDVTLRHVAQARAEYLATHDRLTRLPNRALLFEQLGEAIAAAPAGQLGLMLVRLRRVQRLNDHLGHAVGDEALRQIALRLARCAGPGDTLAGLGGAAFALLVRSVEESDQLSRIAEAVGSAVTAPLNVQGHRLTLGCAIGIALYPRDGTTPEALLRSAGVALRGLEEIGDSGFRFYAEQLNRRASARLKLESDLRQAVERGELTLHYQPQVDLRTFGLIGLEALLRWRHPERGLITPGEFIALAEESGLIVSLGDFVLEQAFRQARAWADQGHRLCLAINLSARQFLHPDLVAKVGDLLARFALEPGRIEFEITESAALHDIDEVIERLRALKALGVRLAIDDFGTGYSSLNYLRRFPLDKLKIDRSFVADISAGGSGEAIVAAVIAMARSMDLTVTAEGVENERQLTYLQAFQCDEAQGYYFGRAIEAERLDLANWRAVGLGHGQTVPPQGEE